MDTSISQHTPDMHNKSPSRESAIIDFQSNPPNAQQFLDCPMPETTEIKAMLELLMVKYL
jgi:hypothetical protein